VRSNCIAFGLIDTRLTRPKESGTTITVAGEPVSLGIPLPEGGIAERDEHWSQMIPLARVGTVDEAAGAIFFLISPFSNYVNGHCLEVCFD
jgi:3-oxoacyl-[acyl-carrier protein] reductase